jgi:hypothetical protein
MASEIWSQTLSGWPAETDSEVNIMAINPFNKKNQKK